MDYSKGIVGGGGFLYTGYNNNNCKSYGIFREDFLTTYKMDSPGEKTQ